MKIIVFSAEGCGDCDAAKAYLEGKNLDIEYRDIAAPENKQELMRKYRRLGVPTLVIGNEVITGFEENQDKIEELINARVMT